MRQIAGITYKYMPLLRNEAGSKDVLTLFYERINVKHCVNLSGEM